MHYYGGKYMTGKAISEVLKELSKDKDIKAYIEPFCGALGVMRHMATDYKCFASDGCEDLIMLWEAVQKNEFKKPEMSLEVWNSLKKAAPSALRSYAGFGLSYSGKWFCSYEPLYRSNDVNKQAYDSLMDIRETIKDVKFSHLDYKECFDLSPGGYLVYCDPPYINSKVSHKGSSCSFGTAEFWDLMRQWRSWGNIVVVSEREAPNDFTCIWSKKLPGMSKSSYVDKLFI